MSFSKRLVLSVALPLFSFLVVSCGSDPLPLPEYSNVRNVYEAPPALRAAARAVVKIQAPGLGTGTGTFISTDGLLLTNNHVLGIDEATCAREGCHIRLYLHYQLGFPANRGVDVFAEPLKVAVALDAALYQIWTDGTKTRKFTSPGSLPVRALTSQELQGITVNLVGHPKGSVKKWARGRVIGRRGSWIHTTSYSLPGNSGSPFLDDKGNIVGLLHRHFLDAESVSAFNLSGYSIGTASADLAQWLQSKPDTSAFFSIAEPHPVADIAKYHAAYLMAHTSEALVREGKRISVLEAIGRRCDGALGREDYRNPNAVEKALAACEDVWAWINCGKATEGQGYKQCPSGRQKEKWEKRFDEVTRKKASYNQRRVYYWALSKWRLDARSPRQKTDFGRNLLGAYLDQTHPALDFELAYFLLYFRGRQASYGGTDVTDFVLNYRYQPDYRFQYDWIFTAHDLLYSDGLISREDFLRAMRWVLSDPQLDLGNKLNLEERLYNYGLLPTP